MNVSGAFQLDERALDAIAARVADMIDPSASAEGWIGVADAAEHLACTERRIYDLVHQRRIPFAKDGTRLLFKRAQLDSALDHSEAGR